MTIRIVMPGIGVDAKRCEGVSTTYELEARWGVAGVVVSQFWNSKRFVKYCFCCTHLRSVGKVNMGF
jgi:hypothetical protein